jgi:hypothetical protein
MDSFQDFARIMTERKQFSHLLDKFLHLIINLGKRHTAQRLRQQ